MFKTKAFSVGTLLNFYLTKKIKGFYIFTKMLFYMCRKSGYNVLAIA